MAMAAWVDKVNSRVADSPVGRYFRLDGSGHPLQRKGSAFLTELRAGTITFAAMAYILSVNASILSATGGPCVCPHTDADPVCDNDTAYQLCAQAVGRDYVTATAAISTIATGLMGLLANMPLGLAPGLGVNAYFAFTVVGFAGTGMVSYGEALAAVFLEGWIFFALSLVGLRQVLGRILPRSIALATGVAIGLFLAFIGLGPNGLGVIGGNSADLVGLGGCPAAFKDPDSGFCTGHVLQDPRVWLGVLLGGILTGLLLMYRVRGALLWPILLVSIASWPRSGSVTEFPHTPTGDSGFDFFKKVATWHSFEQIGPSNMDWGGFSSGKVWIALISFLYIDILDTTGTLYAMSRHAGLMDDRSGDFEGSSVAYLVDAICISFGSLMGLSPSTAFIESASGISEGGRTGLTAIATSFWFFLSLFFAPIFASFPSWATGATLVIVGGMMMQNAALINFDSYVDSIPAFVTIIMVPFSFNIAYGLIAGICTFIILHNVPLLIKYASGGRIVPADWETREPYSVTRRAMAGRSGVRGILPPWLNKLLSGNTKFWVMTDEEIESYRVGRRVTAARAQRKAEARERERLEMRKAFEDPNSFDDEDTWEDNEEALEKGSGSGSSDTGGAVLRKNATPIVSDERQSRLERSTVDGEIRGPAALLRDQERTASRSLSPSRRNPVPTGEVQVVQVASAAEDKP